MNKDQRVILGIAGTLIIASSYLGINKDYRVKEYGSENQEVIIRKNKWPLDGKGFTVFHPGNNYTVFTMDSQDSLVEIRRHQNLGNDNSPDYEQPPEYEHYKLSKNPQSIGAYKQEFRDYKTKFEDAKAREKGAKAWFHECLETIGDGFRDIKFYK